MNKLQIQMVYTDSGAGSFYSSIYYFSQWCCTHTHRHHKHFIYNKYYSRIQKKIVLFAFCYWNNNMCYLCVSYFLLWFRLCSVCRVCICSRTSLYTNSFAHIVCQSWLFACTQHRQGHGLIWMQYLCVYG